MINYFAFLGALSKSESMASQSHQMPHCWMTAVSSKKSDEHEDIWICFYGNKPIQFLVFKSGEMPRPELPVPLPFPPSGCLTHCHQHSSHFMSGQWTLIISYPTVAGITASAVPGAWKDVDICFISLIGTGHKLHAVTNLGRLLQQRVTLSCFLWHIKNVTIWKMQSDLNLRVKVSVTCAEITKSDLV